MLPYILNFDNPTFLQRLSSLVSFHMLILIKASLSPPPAHPPVADASALTDLTRKRKKKKRKGARAEAPTAPATNAAATWTTAMARPPHSHPPHTHSHALTFTKGGLHISVFLELRSRISAREEHDGTHSGKDIPLVSFDLLLVLWFHMCFVFRALKGLYSIMNHSTVDSFLFVCFYFWRSSSSFLNKQWLYQTPCLHSYSGQDSVMDIAWGNTLQPFAWSGLSQRYMASCKCEIDGFFCCARFKRKPREKGKENIALPKKSIVLSMWAN